VPKENKAIKGIKTVTLLKNFIDRSLKPYTGSSITQYSPVFCKRRHTLALQKTLEEVLHRRLEDILKLPLYPKRGFT
jgi:hypothetical protein